MLISKKTDIIITICKWRIENSVVGAGAIITKDMPANSIAYGVNQFKAKKSRKLKRVNLSG